METATPDKPEICVLATQLRLDPDMVIGKLVRIWSWAEVNRVKGNDLGVTREFLDKLAGKKGFAAAMERCGWLRESEGRLAFVNFERHNGPSGKGRALTAQRVAKHREKKRSLNDQIVTNTIPESEISNDKNTKIEADSDDVNHVQTTDNPLEINHLNEDEPVNEAVLSSAEFQEDADDLNHSPEEDHSTKKRRSRGAGGVARKVPVADPPDQPLLF